MKQKVEETVLVERTFCDICKKEVPDDGYEARRKRLAIVMGLFKTDTFDAHEACVNKVIRSAFQKYFPAKN